MNILIEKMLAKRGITPDIWESYNDPGHGLLAHVDELAEKLHQVHDAGEEITILPDFDMDGIMSGTVGYAGLSALGFDVNLFVPNPKDGYGFGRRQIDRLLSDFPYTDAIITCDTGIGCAEGVTYAKEKGLKVLVTDHHMESPECSPREIADVCVDPCGVDDDYDHPAICGAHVLWQCLDRYAELYGDELDRKRLWYLRVFAGIGTISDVMPVLYENRQLVKDAVEISKRVWTTSEDFLSVVKDAPSGYTQAFRGVYAAMNMFAGAGKLKDPSDVDEEFFGFYLAPTFNAVKRMDGDMKRAFDVFLGTSPSKEVDYLLDLNEQRKKCVNEALAKILAQDNPLAPFCYVSDAIPGIMGLLAMKLSQSSGLPCVVVRENPNHTFSGSGRSPAWYPFITATCEIDAHIAGHEGAFGCSFPGYATLAELAELLMSDVEKALEVAGDSLVSAEDACDFAIAGDARSDGDVGLDVETMMEFIEEAEEYRPFGRGFEAPQALLTFDAASAVFVPIGADKTHLKIRLPLPERDKNGKTDYFDVLCWGQADFIKDGEPTGQVKIVGTLAVNSFGGRKMPQFSGDILG